MDVGTKGLSLRGKLGTSYAIADELDHVGKGLDSLGNIQAGTESQAQEKMRKLSLVCLAVNLPSLGQPCAVVAAVVC